MKNYFKQKLLIFLVFLPGLVYGWDGDPTVNQPVCQVSGYQYYPVITSDGISGFITVWIDQRSGSHANLYVQRVNNQGTPVWTTNGVPVTRAPGNQLYPVVTPDGAGGVFIFWEDYRNGDADIYGQRINLFGNITWETDGKSICMTAGDQKNITATLNGSMNVCIAWEDYRSDPAGDIYVQRITGDGSLQWGLTGIPVCTLPLDQWNPRICSDRFNNCYVVWEDFRNSYDTDIYAQKITNSGTMVWGTNGVALFKSLGTQSNVQVIPNESGGIIAVCNDVRSDPLGDVVAQRLDLSGTRLWGYDYIGVDLTTGFQSNINIVTDGAGGAIISWLDGRDNLNGDIYAQRLSPTGTKLWGSISVPVNTEPETKKSLVMVPGINHDAIMVWEKWITPFDTDLYAQKISGSGATLWNPAGNPVSSAWEDQIDPVILPDNQGGAFCVWTDYRNEGLGDIYAQRIYKNGNLYEIISPHGVPILGNLARLLLLITLTFFSTISKLVITKTKKIWLYAFNCG